MLAISANVLPAIAANVTKVGSILTSLEENSAIASPNLGNCSPNTSNPLFPPVNKLEILSSKFAPERITRASASIFIPSSELVSIPDKLSINVLRFSEICGNPLDIPAPIPPMILPIKEPIPYPIFSRMTIPLSKKVSNDGI